jgi:hypothetical protein
VANSVLLKSFIQTAYLNQLGADYQMLTAIAMEQFKNGVNFASISLKSIKLCQYIY